MPEGSSKFTGLLVGGLLLGAVGLYVFAGSGEPTVKEGPSASEQLPVELLANTWIVQVADDNVRQPFDAQPGWIKLIAKRDYRSAAKQLGSSPGLTSARAHADAAGMYRQASLMAANSLIETYYATPKPEDPKGTAHLLMVSFILNGELDKAKEQAARLDGVTDDPSAAWDAPWRAWLDSGEAWPPDLSSLPISLPEPTPGEWPGAASSPSYVLYHDVPAEPEPDEGEAPAVVQEVTEAVEARGLEVDDLSSLVALALWHDSVARTSAGDQAAVVDTYGARYRWKVEGPVKAPAELPLEMTFGSDYFVPGDGPFMADVFGEKGAAAVQAHQKTSFVAALAAMARSDGAIEPEKAQDVAATVREALLDEQRVKSGGTLLGFHRTFADIAQVAVLRDLALIAEVEGNRETSGILRINAMERSGKEHTACPAAALSMAAYDSSNRYPLRPLDTLHNLIRRYPSLETARFSLDALAIRVSLESTGGPSN